MPATHGDKPNIYLPRLPVLSSDDMAVHMSSRNARENLVMQLAAAGMRVPFIDGADSWIKNMLDHAEQSDAFVFPPMSSLPRQHHKYIGEAAQRWFELLSVVTGIHIGNPEKFAANGISKPCVLMDPDGQWQSKAISLLHYLSEMGMFTSKVDDIIQVAPPPDREGDFRQRNENAVRVLQETIAASRGKIQSEVHTKYPPSHMFRSFRRDLPRHPFGVAFFGSATTREPSYKILSEELGHHIGLRGWRLVSGAGIDGCMGAADRGFAMGALDFNSRLPHAKFKPAHVGVSTQAILRLEGPPEGIDQLIVTEHIYDRMKVMIRGQKTVKDAHGNDSYDPIRAVRDTVRLAFVAPGGTGTLHEFATMMQLATKGEMMKDRRIVLLNFPSHRNPAQGFWDPLIAIARQLGFDQHFSIAATPDEAIAIADGEFRKWLERNPAYNVTPA